MPLETFARYFLRHHEVALDPITVPPNPERDRAELGRRQLAWCRRKFGVFRVCERQAQRAVRSTERSKKRKESGNG